MKKFLSSALIIIMIVICCGCPSKPEPATTSVQTESDPGYNTLYLINKSDHVPTELYMKYSDSDNWGYDLLPGPLYYDEAIQINNIPDGYFDLYVRDDYENYWEGYEIPFFNEDFVSLNLSATANKVVIKHEKSKGINPKYIQSYLK